MANSEAFILVVEDDLEIRTTLEQVLLDEGYRVRSAVHGKEALDLLLSSQEKPFLILLDIMMPVMDAFRFREEQLKTDALSQIPTVLLSADGRLPEKAARAKTQHYLKKPVDLDRLFSLVEQLKV